MGDNVSLIIVCNTIMGLINLGLHFGNLFLNTKRRKK